MKNDLVKKLLPHVIALVIFLIISILFCRPALEGNVLGEQHDVMGWKGVAQNAFDYKENHGHFPLWNPNVFSGMPNYMIAMEGKSILPDVSKIISLGLPQPISFFFVACLCFYILCITLRINPYVGIFGALTYAFATYNPIILAAGHITKMFAIAYTPLLLAGLMLTFNKKYWLGLAVTTLGVFIQVGANHPQISFYAFVIAAAMTLSYLVVWIKNKEWKHIVLAAGVSLVALLAGLAGTALGFLTAREYAKSTIRGGRNVAIEGNSVVANKTQGLDTAYAFSYSLNKGEAITMLMPNAYGGSTRKTYDEKSKVFTRLVDRGVPDQTAIQFVSTLPKFWGETDSTAGGPLYAGAITCILALIGFVLLKHPLRWGLLAVTVIGLMMAFGKYLPGFNLFLFENLPFYNKFRAPSMSMVILQITIPIMAALTLNFLLFRENARELLKRDFKKILFTVGGLFVFLIGMYLTLTYKASFDPQIVASTGNEEMGRLVVSAMKEERKSMFGGQLLRTLGYVLFVLGALYAYSRSLKYPVVIALSMALVTIVDQLVIDKFYLGEDKYFPKDQVDAEHFAKSPLDQQLLADTTHYRVYNSGPDRFSASDYKVSVFHKAVGGYHPAKLSLYQDIIERYLSGGNYPQILNMLNTKYIIVQNPQDGQNMLFPNSDPYGPAWFVKNVKLVKDDAEELQAIGTTYLKDTAIVQVGFTADVKQPQWDSAASIRMSKFDNDEIDYTTNSSTPQFAVFSEVYYPNGWNAYIDGQKVNYVKANYVLRGLTVPAGSHSIKFKYEPATYKKAVSIAYIGSFIIALFVLGGFFMDWWQYRKKKPKSE